jgi:hypothetical protein
MDLQQQDYRHQGARPNRRLLGGDGKRVVEGCRHIDVLDLRRDGYLQPPAPGKPPYAVMASCGGYRRKQHIDVTWSRCRFGGQRPWFRCAGCGRRVVRLYIVQAVFACRRCHRLGYASQSETPHERGTGRTRKIRMRLSDGKDDPSGEFPSRPRFMHRATYARWRQSYDDAEERSAIGLWNFVERLTRRSGKVRA